MKKSIKNTDGFGAVGILLVVVVLGLIGFVGYYVYNRQHKATASSQSTPAKAPPDQTAKQTPAADPYEGWKTYTSSVEGFSFKYPANWRLSDTLDPRDTLGKEAISLKASNNFTLSFDLYKVDSDSNFGCGGCVFNGATALNVKNYGKQLYSVVDSQKVNGHPFQTLSISEHKDRSQQRLQSWPYYASKTQSGYVVRWTGEYVIPAAAGGELVYSSYDDFIKKPEVVTATKVLGSLSY